MECDEEQPNPDDDSFQSCTSSSQPVKRHRTTKNRAKEAGGKKQLNKKERKTIMDSISKLLLPQLEDVKGLLLSQIWSDISIVDQ